MRLARHMPLIGFTALAGLILGPLLLPGYILTLDMSWTPHIPFRPELTNLYPLHWLLYVLGLVLPSMLIQKVLLWLIFALAGLGMYRLVRQQLEPMAAWLSGLVYMINPFVYERLMAGQYLVLAGYAMLPWFVGALWQFLDDPVWRRAAMVAGWSVVVGWLSIHALGFMALLTIVSVIAWSINRWRQTPRIAAWLSGIGGVWLVVNSFWLISPSAGGPSGVRQQVASFGWDQFKAYATAGGSLGVPLNTWVLQGFWSEPYGHFIIPSALPTFWLGAVPLMALVIMGVVRSVRRRDRLGLALAIAGSVAWVLAMGVAWAPAAGLTHWLVAHVPFYQGYRDSQKWLVVSLLGYAYLAAAGCSWLTGLARGWWREAVVIISLLAPLAMTPVLLWGAGGQLRSSYYPASWQQLKDRLSVNLEGSTLILPWHQYLSLDFAGRAVANPLPAYLGGKVVASDNPELLGVAAATNNIVNNAVEGQVLALSYYSHELGAKLAPLGVRRVVLLKQADWTNYHWLDAQTDLSLVAETSGWKLYEVKEAQ